MPRTWFLFGCIAYSFWGCSGRGALPKYTNDAAAAVGQEAGASKYIEKRYQWYQANAPHIAYEAYFNESSAYYAGSIVPVVGAPNSAARYKELW